MNITTTQPQPVAKGRTLDQAFEARNKQLEQARLRRNEAQKLDLAASDRADIASDNLRTQFARTGRRANLLGVVTGVGSAMASMTGLNLIGQSFGLASSTPVVVIAAGLGAAIGVSLGSVVRSALLEQADLERREVLIPDLQERLGESIQATENVIGALKAEQAARNASILVTETITLPSGTKEGS